MKNSYSKNISFLSYYTTILFSFFFLLTANSQTFNWIKSGYRLDCNNGVYPTDVSADGNNVYTTGYYYSQIGMPVDFDGQTLQGYTSNTFESNIFIAKYNSTGAIQWLKRMGTDRMDGTYARIENDVTGNTIVACGLSGTTNGSAGYIDGTTMAQTVLPNDGLVAKFSSSGTLTWYKHFRGTGSINIYDLKTNSSGEIYITGNFNGALNIDTSNFTGSAGINSNFFIAKLDASGNLLWWKNATGNGHDAGYKLAVKGNDVYVFGIFSDTNSDTDMALNGNTYTIPNANYDAHFVAKYSSTGTLTWLRYGFLQDSGGGNGTMPDYCGISVDANDNIYSIFSVSQSGAGIVYAFAGSTSTYTCTGSGGSDYILVKYDNNGNLQWVKGNGGNSSNNNLFPTSMINYSNGRLVTTMMLEGTAGIGNLSVTSAGNTDAIFAAFDYNGNLLCKKQYGNTNQDWPKSIAEASSGRLAYTGHIFGSTAVANIGSYDGKNISGCRNTGITGLTDTTDCLISTGINNNYLQNNITIYPNPASNFITIHNRNGTAISSIKLYNTLGQIIYTQNNISEKEYKIDLTSISSGIYLIEIDENGIISKNKFIKK